jgi:CheY-like chemotaxis protein
VPRLFEPFTQVDPALDRQRGGLGLGLAIAKGMVELHGGSIRVDSEGPGTGARFTIVLPQETCELPPADREHPDTVAATAVRRVLVIEDNPDAANALCNVLELAGHRAQVAFNGPDGLRHARAFAPDVVFCDIGLPEMDGYQVARALRADRLRRARHQAGQHDPHRAAPGRARRRAPGPSVMRAAPVLTCCCS